jgi:hypothetical protein
MRVWQLSQSFKRQGAPAKHSMAIHGIPAFSFFSLSDDCVYIRLLCCNILPCFNFLGVALARIRRLGAFMSRDDSEGQEDLVFGLFGYFILA